MPHENIISTLLGQIAESLHDLPTDLPRVVFCQHGIRSLKASAALDRLGFGAQRINLEGGMAAYDATLKNQ